MALFSKSRLALGTVILTASVLAGCAGNPPTTEMDVAQQAVNSATGSGATQYAPADMQSANANLRKARVAVEEKKFEEAKLYAEKATWDARVAERKSQIEKAKIVDPTAIIDAQK